MAKKHHGFRSGSENGERGYFLTFRIAYLRDISLKYTYIAESFETSCNWSDVKNLCDKTRARIISECLKYKIKKAPFISFRVT